MNTPYQWTKQVASHWGGTRNGTIVHWPKGIKAKGEIRSQFHHVIDVAPTILEAAGLPEPVSVNGVQQDPIEGVSMLYSLQRRQGGGAARDAVLRDVRQPRHLPQGLDRGDQAQDALGSHGREDSRPSTTTSGSSTTPARTGARRTTSPRRMPEKLHELQRLWLIEATRYKVLPLDDRLVEKMNPDTAGRPVLIKGKTQLLFGGMGRLSENCVLSIKNKSHSVTAEIVVPGEGRRGRDHRAGRRTSAAGASTPRTASSSTATTGAASSTSSSSPRSRFPRASIRCAWSSPTPAAASARAARSTLYIDGKKVGEGEIAATAGDGLLRRRRLRRRRGQRRAGLPGLRPARQRLQRHGQGRAARHRRRCRKTRTTWSRRRTRSASRWRGSEKRDEGRVSRGRTRGSRVE